MKEKQKCHTLHQHHTRCRLLIETDHTKARINTNIIIVCILCTAATGQHKRKKKKN